MDCLLSAKGESDFIAIGFADGKVSIVNRFGKVDKTIQDAHKGSITSIKWSHDGQTICSTGEDGTVKIWSKSGMLRTELLTLEQGVYSVDWNAEDDYIACGTNKVIYIKPLQPGNREHSWKAHDGVVLKIDWNQINGFILSSGEDCKVKIWDSYGRALYASTPWDHVVTSVSWAPNGEYFAAGSFGTIKLCDKSGWTQSVQKIEKGSVLDLKWSKDSTLLAVGTAQGTAMIGTLTDQMLEWENYEATITADHE